MEKALMIAGLGSDRLRRLPVDANFAMVPEALDQALRDDRERGFLPCFVCATLGTTSSNAMDPLPRIAAICAAHGVWLHVDAAMCGSAAICPEYRTLLYGPEPTAEALGRVDSYCVNAHKWLFVNFDCSCFWVADQTALIQALSVLPEYLRNPASESGQVIDYRDWQIPLGRRFRALKLWFVLRCFGVEGLQRRLRKHVRLAQEFAGWVAKHPCFELAAPVPLSLVCFRHQGSDARNEQILERVNNEGKVFLTHTRLNERFTLRLSVGQTRTRRRHVKQAWKSIRAAT
jgi:aromatic-L-amino-acid decarboxylase